MKNLFYTLLFSLAIMPGIVHAQQDPMISQYMFSGHFINPGYAGSHPYANLTLLGRKQWVGFNGSPFTSYLSFDMPIENKRLGIGGLISADRIGVTNRTEVTGSVAYHLPVGPKAHLSLGLRAGVTHYNAFLNDLTYWDQSDEIFSSNVTSKFLPIAGAGLYFYTQRFYAGISIPNVISYKPETLLNAEMNNTPFLERHYIGNIGYAIPAGENIDIKPSILVKYVKNAPVEADYNLHVLFYKTLWIGASYRSGDAVVGMMEFQATKNLRIGYSYDITITPLRNQNSGSHEIMIAWDFVKDEDARFKSPRFF
jgi:type IX secretion system PorP/SprF family membrane protein